MTKQNNKSEDEFIKCTPEEFARELEGCKPLKLFGGNPLPKDWTVEKAVAQMNKVSKHSCSVEEAMRALGLKPKDDLV